MNNLKIFVITVLLTVIFWTTMVALNPLAGYLELIVSSAILAIVVFFSILSAMKMENKSKLMVIAGISGGIAVTPLNNNRNSANTSDLLISKAVSGSGGTLISQVAVGGEAFKANFGGAVKRSDELILKSGTDYRREFISSSDDNVVSFKATWYEHVSNGD